MTIITLAAEVLKAPAALIDRIEGEGSFAERAPQLLGILAVGGAVFGAVAGGFRGGLQVPLAAMKMPLLLLIPVLLVLPALRGLWSLCGVEVSYRRLVLAGLVGAARTAMLAAAAGPLLWLAFGVVDYHLAVLTFAVSLAAAGLPGIVVLARAVPHGGRMRVVALAGSLALLGVSTMQTGWLLRPFLVRPKTQHVVVIRAIEEDVFSALEATAWSSAGRYDRARFGEK